MSAHSTVVRGYDRLAPIYDSLAALYSGRRIGACHRIIADRLGEGERVLFAGVGTGRDAEAAAGRGIRPTLLDSSRGMLERAAARVRRTGVEPEVVHADLRDCEGAGGFDAVVASFFLNVFSTDEADDIIRRLRDSVRPGGRILVADFAPSRGVGLRPRLQRLYHDIPMHVFHRWTGNALHRIHDIGDKFSHEGIDITRRTPVRIFSLGPAWLEVIEGRRSG